MKINYRCEIDGLRTIAVLSVILYHAQIVVFGHDFFKGGFVGVDIFFVISGYLISRILLSELFEKGKISFLQFYERRARRILPISFTVFIASFPLAYKYLLPYQLIEYAQSILSATFFGSNIFFYFTNTQYGAEDSLLQPFLHTWSLGVEEQFYILFPIVLLLAYKFAKNYLVTIIAVLILISLTYADWLSTKNTQLNFFMLTSRLWELGIGSLLAFYELKYGRVKHELLNQTMPLLGLAMIAYAIVFFNNQTPHPSFITLLPTLGTALIILYSVNTKDLVGKVLSWKPIVGVGLISYSMYLWHYPIFAFARIWDANGLHNDEKYLLILLTIILSIISYFVIEKPFRNKSLISKQKLILFLLSCISLILIIHLKIIFSDGMKERIDTIFKNEIINKKTEIQSDQINFEEIRKIMARDIIKVDDDPFDNNDCVFWRENFDSLNIIRFDECKKKYKKAIFIIGDSHAINLYHMFALSKKHKFIFSIAHGNCRPHGCNTKQNHFEYLLNKFIHKLNQDDLIIYHQSGAHLLLDNEGRNDTQKIFEDNFYKVDKENVEIVEKYLNILKEKTQAKIIWIGPYTEYRYEPSELIWAEKEKIIEIMNIHPTSLLFFKNLDEDIKKILNIKNPKFSYEPFNKVHKIKTNAIVITKKDGKCFQFQDTDHFSKCGIEEISSNLESYALDLLRN